MDSATEEAWKEVQFHWDTAYLFDYFPTRPEPFIAARRDDPAVVLADKNPSSLQDKVWANYHERPVPREFAP
jgi:hypothetical protein